MSSEEVSSATHSQASGDRWAEHPAEMPEPKSSRLRIGLFVLLAVFFVWQITTRSLVAYLAENSPEAALKLRSGDATALINLAENALTRRRVEAEKLKVSDAAIAQTAEPNVINMPNEDEKIRVWAEAALLDEPLNARALGILGQLAIKGDDKERTESLMNAAAHLSLRESGAIFWLMQHNYEKQNFGKVIYYADIILRTRGRLARYVVPFLARIAENKKANPEFKKLLADNPRWRGHFFALLPNSISNTNTPLDLLLSLKESQAPATTREIRSYLNFLIKRKFYQIAYYTWLQFLPPEQLAKAGFLVNGSFETVPGGLPFDWNIKQGSGVTIDLTAHPDEDVGHALFIEFGHGRVEFRDVTQMTMLAPGSYRLRGKYKGQIIGRRGLIWRIRCFGGRRQLLGEGPMFVGVARNWESFMATFTVPAENCRAQQVSLHFDARSASEQLVTGRAWYDDLVISRIAQPVIGEPQLP